MGSPTGEQATKKKRSFAAGEKNKRAKTTAPKSSLEVVITSPPPGPIIDTVVYDDDGKTSDDGASLHKRRHSSATQHNAPSAELTVPTEDDASVLWGKFDLANFLASEGLQSLIHKKEELTSERDQLLVERDQTDAVVAATERKAATAKKVSELEATLNSKIEELTMREKRDQLEKRHKNTIEHNMLFSSTVPDLDISLRSVRSFQESLFTEIRRKTLEESKTGIIDFDAEITKASKLELTAKNGLPTQSDAPGCSGSSFKFLRTEEESEVDDAEDQTGENIESSVDPPTSPDGADTSLPPGFGYTVV
ncbi:uncharacterized protein [Nicotiana sylvestris]|uniref:uncharacterized protein n=1 Tax=Nicotiana sylvestris TaxID=4096 RepID=UPI00388CBAF6